MTALEKIHHHLHENIFVEDYHIPYDWNFVKCPFEKSDKHGEIIVNPNVFFCRTIEYILSQKENFTDSLTVYSVFIRAFSAWDHGNGLEGGNLLKTLCLLPVIKDMGFDTVYLLPIFEMSHKNKKGELPSPYAVKNIMKIDNSLGDRHLRDIDTKTLFKAFCEAAHHLGIKVILDFVFRTCSRDSVLVNSHPDWFYWINVRDEQNFSAPKCEELPHTVVTEKNVKHLYKSPEMESFANSFAFPPKKEMFSENEDISENAREKLGITVMPGFADTINDPQPPWTDITFLKFYNDNTHKAVERFGEEFPPMIAQDGIKCSIFEGRSKNTELWRYIENVVPYYMTEYSIDGARIDMAHALPKEVMENIINQVKAKNKNFILWSEEFETEKSGELKKEGYSFFTGGVWDLWDESTYSGMTLNKRLIECISGDLPCMSCVETPDTPRCSQKLGLLRTIAAVFITALLPNSCLFINNGLEMSERQPMNLGLNNSEKGRYVLPKNHMLYGKVAFFDNFYFDWTNRKHLFRAMKKALEIRKRYIDIISNKDYLDFKLLKNSSSLTVICSFDKKKGFLALINRGSEEIKVYLKNMLPENCEIGECIYGVDNRNILYPNSVLIYDIKGICE